MRALDPVLATALGPAQKPREAFQIACEDLLRGRPNGPLLLTLWMSATAGEIDHQLLRRLLELMPTPMPDRLETRKDLLAHIAPKAECIAMWALALAKRNQEEAIGPATQLGCGFVITRLITDLPSALSANHVYLPNEDLVLAGATTEDLIAGVRTPAVNDSISPEYFALQRNHVYPLGTERVEVDKGGFCVANDKCRSQQGPSRTRNVPRPDEQIARPSDDTFTFGYRPRGTGPLQNPFESDKRAGAVTAIP